MLPSQQLFEGLDFQAYGSVPAKRPFSPVLNTYMLGERNSKVFSLKWVVKHFALIFPSQLYRRVIWTNKSLCLCSSVILCTESRR